VLQVAAREGVELSSAVPQTIQTRGLAVSLPNSDGNTPPVTEGSPRFPSVIVTIENGDGPSSSPNWGERDPGAAYYGLSKKLGIDLEEWIRLTAMRCSNYPLPKSQIGQSRVPITSHKSGRNGSTRSSRHPQQLSVSPAAKLSKGSSSRGLTRYHLPKSSAESAQPELLSRPAHPIEAPPSPSSTGSECTFATAPNSQSGLQGPIEAQCQSKDKAAETRATIGPSFYRQSYPERGLLLPRSTQDVQDLRPGPMSGSFPSFDGVQQNPHETTSNITQVRDLSGTGSRHSRGLIDRKRLRSDACSKTTPEEEKSAKTSMRSQPLQPRRHQRSDTSWRRGHE
jgi:hypothetical protein